MSLSLIFERLIIIVIINIIQNIIVRRQKVKMFSGFPHTERIRLDIYRMGITKKQKYKENEAAVRKGGKM